MSRDEEQNPFTSADRNLLRLAVHYGGRTVPVELARGLGVTRQAAGTAAKLLGEAGYLTVDGPANKRVYSVTAAGLAYLDAHKVTHLLVEVDDRVAEDVAAHLGTVNGVEMVSDHGTGCCCKNCPWKGDHG